MSTKRLSFFTWKKTFIGTFQLIKQIYPVADCARDEKTHLKDHREDINDDSECRAIDISDKIKMVPRYSNFHRNECKWNEMCVRHQCGNILTEHFALQKVHYRFVVVDQKSQFNCHSFDIFNWFSRQYIYSQKWILWWKESSVTSTWSSFNRLAPIEQTRMECPCKL